MSNKSRIHVTVDPNVLDRFDAVVNNRSKRLEDFMRKVADIEDGKDRDLIERKEDLEEEISQLKEEIEQLQADKANRKGQLESVKSALEQKEEEKESLHNAVEALTSRCKELRIKKGSFDDALRHLRTTEQFHKWLERLSITDDELIEEVEKQVK